MPDRSTELPDLAAVSAGFARHLRDVGVPVGPEQAGRFAAALQLATPLTTDEVYWLGRVTLVTTRPDIVVYERVFNDVFRGVSDVADRRGDPNQPSLDALDRRPRPQASDPHDARASDGGHPSSRAATPERAHDVETGEVPAGAPASPDQLLRHRDFAECTAEELARLREVTSALALSAPRQRSRRQRRHRTGASIDRRATLRRSHRTGGHPVQLVRRRRTERQRRVVLIADVSGSMEAYSRAYLYLLHGAVRAVRGEAFVFSTDITRLTRELQSTNPEHALRAAMDSVDDWSGGTRIGASLKTFIDRWGRRGLARGAVVIIVSDGWESGDPEVLGDQMARLSRLARRIIWVNPRARSEQYRPLVGGMAAAMPHVDRFVSGHSLAAMDDVLSAIADLAEPLRRI